MIDELVDVLETGSSVVDARLCTIYSNSSLETASYLLDELAWRASEGSPYALRLLLTIIADHNLAQPGISRYIDNAGMREDVVQDVLIAVSRSIHRYRRESKFTTWLYSVARNSAVSELRRVQPTVSIDEEIAAETEGQRFSSRAADRQVIENAISQLPAIFRETVYLRDVQRMSYDEIANQQGLAVNTVRSRLSRGRALLSAQLTEHWIR